MSEKQIYFNEQLDQRRVLLLEKFVRPIDNELNKFYKMCYSIQEFLTQNKKLGLNLINESIPLGNSDLVYVDKNILLLDRHRGFIVGTYDNKSYHSVCECSDDTNFPKDNCKILAEEGYDVYSLLIKNIMKLDKITTIESIPEMAKLTLSKIKEINAELETSIESIKSYVTNLNNLKDLELKNKLKAIDSILNEDFDIEME